MPEPIATMDFETYSEAGLYWDPASGCFKSLIKSKTGIDVVGSAAYAEHPSTDILSLFYDLPDGRGRRYWLPWLPPPADLLEYIRGGGVVEAHHGLFEYFIWHYICHKKYGWPELRPEQLRCSMIKAMAWGLPGKLALLCKILKPKIVKDKNGERLIKLLSIPQKPTKKEPRLRRTPAEDWPLFIEMYDYNKTDVESEMEISSLVPDLVERDLYETDKRINIRGVAIDVETLDIFLERLEEFKEIGNKRLQWLTGGAVQSADEVKKIRAFIEAHGVPTDSLDKDALEELLKRADLPPIVREVLEIRSNLGSKSTAKIYSMKYRLNSDRRIRGLLQMYGAERTGRFAGRGPQPQNLPGSGPQAYKCPHCGRVHGGWCLTCNVQGRKEDEIDWGIDAIEQVIADFHAIRDTQGLTWAWTDPLKAMAGSLRGLFIAGPGMELVSSDYSAIEAVVLAVLAGEQWRVEVFRTHGKIYEMSASKISGIPFEEFLRYKEENGVHHPLRKKLGKVAELASGYAGWIGAWLNFGAGDFMNEEEIKHNILKWRAESPAIVEFWGGQWRKHPRKWEFKREMYGIEGAAVQAVAYPGTPFSYRGITYFVQNDVLYCRIPSGRLLSYHQPRLNLGYDKRGLEVYQLSYMGYNRDNKRGPVGWLRIKTYGGKLTENIVQATARDLLTPALIRLDHFGYPPVLHVHDEITSEVPEGLANVKQFEYLMSIMPFWALGWPVRAAGGWIGKRFRK